MTNIFVPIDIAWSYHFMKGLEKNLETINRYHFTDNIYKLIAEYVRLTHNFRVNQTNVLHNESVHAIWMELEKNWDIPVPYIQVAFRQLFNSILCVSNSIPNQLCTVSTMTDDMANLIGFVFSVSRD